MTIDQALNNAMQVHQQGRLPEAEALYRQVLAANPNHPDALHLLGMVAMQVGRPQVALELIGKAIQISPGAAQFHCNLGQAMQMSGKTEEAIRSFRQALLIRPDYPEANYNLGSVLSQSGNPAEAIEPLQRSVAARPKHATGHNNLGTALRLVGRLDEAIQSFEQALRCKPDYAEAFNNLGSALQSKGQMKQAIELHQAALKIKPDFPEGLNNLGSALQSENRLDEAIQSFRRALELLPDFPDALNNLGVAVKHNGDFEQGIALLRRAVELRPGSTESLGNLGTALLDDGQVSEAIAIFGQVLRLRPDHADNLLNLGRGQLVAGEFEAAIQTLRRAIQLAPDHAQAHFMLGLGLMTLGQLEQGWLEYEWRLQTPVVKLFKRDFAQPRWDGSAIPGKTLLLHVEQGLGDFIQFCRYVPLVAELSQASIILESQPELASLAATLSGIATILPRGEPLPAHDFQCPLLSLPGLFKTSFNTIPADVPYLQVDETKSGKWRQRLSTDSLKIGLVWNSRPHRLNDRHKSLKLAQLAPLAGLPGIALYSLQKGEPSKQLENLPREMQIIDWTSELHDFSDTAALVNQLDLVISVDTAVAHLAGALGRPVWVMLPFSADWRWFTQREDSPWYATMRLFRQPRAGDWQSVIDEVVAAVGSLKSF